MKVALLIDINRTLCSRTIICCFGIKKYNISTTNGFDNLVHNVHDFNNLKQVYVLLLFGTSKQYNFSYANSCITTSTWAFIHTTCFMYWQFHINMTRWKCFQLKFAKMYLSKIDFSFDIYDEFFSFVFIIACNPWLINNHVFLAINEKSSISDNTIRLYSKNVKTNKLSKSLKCLYQYSRKLTASIIVTQPSSVMQSML